MTTPAPNAPVIERIGAAALALLDGVIDALSDVRRLLADGHLNATGGTVEALDGRVVSNAIDRATHDAHDVGES